MSTRMSKRVCISFVIRWTIYGVKHPCTAVRTRHNRKLFVPLLGAFSVNFYRCAICHLITYSEDTLHIRLLGILLKVSLIFFELKLSQSYKELYIGIYHKLLY